MFTLYVTYYDSADYVKGGFVYESDSDLFNERHNQNSKFKVFNNAMDAIDFAIKTFPEGAEIEIQWSGKICNGIFITD